MRTIQIISEQAVAGQVMEKIQNLASYDKINQLGAFGLINSHIKRAAVTASEPEIAVAWITAYAESLAQRRREIAPIDEPCYQWLSTMNEILTEQLPPTR